MNSSRRTSVFREKLFPAAEAGERALHRRIFAHSGERRCESDNQLRGAQRHPDRRKARSINLSDVAGIQPVAADRRANSGLLTHGDAETVMDATYQATGTIGSCRTCIVGYQLTAREREQLPVALRDTDISRQGTTISVDRHYHDRNRAKTDIARIGIAMIAAIRNHQSTARTAHC